MEFTIALEPADRYAIRSVFLSTYENYVAAYEKYTCEGLSDEELIDLVLARSEYNIELLESIAARYTV